MQILLMKNSEKFWITVLVTTLICLWFQEKEVCTLVYFIIFLVYFVICLLGLFEDDYDKYGNKNEKIPNKYNLLFWWRNKIIKFNNFLDNLTWKKTKR